jgi:hypothetical protein
MRAAGIVLLAGLMIAGLDLSRPAIAAGPAVAGKSALELAKQNVQAADFRATGHLVRVGADGKRTSDAIALKAHWFPGILRIEAEIASPSEARAHILLQMHPGGESTIQIARPGDHAPRVLPLESWSSGPLGPAFSYEDLLEAHLFWAHQAVVEQTKYGARDCDVVRSTPGPGDRTGYAEIKSWLDRAIGYPVHVEKTLKKTGVIKEFTYFGLRKNEGVWSASQVEVKVHGQAGSTLLIIDRGSPHAHLDLKDFRAEQLIVFQ